MKSKTCGKMYTKTQSPKYQNQRLKTLVGIYDLKMATPNKP